VHGSSHKGKVFMGKRLLILPALISVKQRLDGMDGCMYHFVVLVDPKVVYALVFVARL
jgi:hypothetical protein